MVGGLGFDRAQRPQKCAFLHSRTGNICFLGSQRSTIACQMGPRGSSIKINIYYLWSHMGLNRPTTPLRNNLSCHSCTDLNASEFLQGSASVLGSCRGTDNTLVLHPLAPEPLAARGVRETKLYLVLSLPSLRPRTQCLPCKHLEVWTACPARRGDPWGNHKSQTHVFMFSLRQLGIRCDMITFAHWAEVWGGTLQKFRRHFPRSILLVPPIRCQLRKRTAAPRVPCLSSCTSQYSTSAKLALQVQTSCPFFAMRPTGQSRNTQPSKPPTWKPQPEDPQAMNNTSNSKLRQPGEP